MTMPGQLEDVLRLSDELDAHKAQRDKSLAKPSTDPEGKAKSFDKLIAEEEAHLERARAQLPPEVLDHVDELRAAKAKFDKAVGKVTDQFPAPGGVDTAGAEGGASDATVKVN
jgi:Skp family chaperone for outer membrane proteins